MNGNGKQTASKMTDQNNPNEETKGEDEPFDIDKILE